MERRTVLGLLGLGLAGSGAVGWSLLQDDRAQSPSPSPPAERSAYQRVHQEVLNQDSIPDFGPTYEFDYGEVRADDVEHPAVEAILAESVPEGDGDRLRLVPGSIAAQRLRERLLAVWLVEETDEVAGTVDDESLTFRGGESEGYAYLVSVPETDTSTLWVIRAETIDAARRIAGG